MTGAHPEACLRGPEIGKIPVMVLGGAETTCPVCDVGVLVDVSFDAGIGGVAIGGRQEPESRQLETYSCGHEFVGPRLAVADPESMTVERRTSEETAMPLPCDEDRDERVPPLDEQDTVEEEPADESPGHAGRS
jgi:hypothetical protein